MHGCVSCLQAVKMYELLCDCAHYDVSCSCWHASLHQRITQSRPLRRLATTYMECIRFAQVGNNAEAEVECGCATARKRKRHRMMACIDRGTVVNIARDNNSRLIVTTV